MKNTVILINNFGMGKADEKLQTMLAAKYFDLLLHNDSLPAAICFYTEGVKLVTEGSPALAQKAEPASKPAASSLPVALRSTRRWRCYGRKAMWRQSTRANWRSTFRNSPRWREIKCRPSISTD